MLPVFLPLRELRHLEEGLDRFIQDQLTSRHLKWEDRTEGSDRVLRGGAWNLTAVLCRSALRYWLGPDNRVLNIGFRLVCLPGQPGKPGKRAGG
jgi:hypothetical protein